MAKKKSSVTMYNLIFPVFMLLWPPLWLMMPIFGDLAGGLFVLGILLGNLAVDWLVTALAMRWQKIPNIKQKSLKALVPVWLSGFAADFVGGLFLFAVVFIDNDWISQNIEIYFYTSIYEGSWALAVTLLAVALAGFCIYRFNMNWSLQQVDLTEQQRRRTALTLAVLTAPWLFLLPTDWFYV